VFPAPRACYSNITMSGDWVVVYRSGGHTCRYLFVAFVLLVPAGRKRAASIHQIAGKKRSETV